MKNLPTFLNYLGLLIIFFIGIDVVATSSLLIFGIKLSALNYPVSLFLACTLLIFLYKKQLNNSSFIFSIFLLIILTFFISLLCSNFYDYSWDGNAYHKTAIGFLANGWNPIIETAKNFADRVYPLISTTTFIWEESYPKATWIFGATSYLFWGNIESGKSYNILMIIAAFSLTFSYLLQKKVDSIYSLFLSLIAAFNPVALAQCLSFYVDGFLQLSIYLLCFELLKILIEVNKLEKRVSIVTSAFLMALAINTKFTGLLFSFFYILFFVFIYFYFTKNLYKTIKISSFFLLSGILSTFWVGANCYTKNLVLHKNIGYPIIGENKIDIIDCNSPFTEVNRLKNLFTSLFSKLDNFVFDTGRVPEFKIPFTLNHSEIDYLGIVDPRLSGFGLFFSGIFIISLILIILFFLREKQNTRNKFLVLMVLLSTTFFSMILTESWWARYAPHIYFIVLLAFCTLNSINDKKLRNFLVILFGSLILVNNLAFLYGPLRFIPSNSILISQLKQVRNSDVCLTHYSPFPGVLFNFLDSNAKVIKCKANDGKPEYSLIQYGTKFKIY